MFQYLQFSDLDPDDTIFTSLREDYPEFDGWFERKLDEPIWVAMDGDKIAAILYLKVEGDRLKIGTLKVAPGHSGKGLAVAAIKLAVNQAILNTSRSVYGTVFPRHDRLIKMIERHGFTFGNELNERGEQVFSRTIY
jgi:RimJ/RimL family protein N-acetyltransferase